MARGEEKEIIRLRRYVPNYYKVHAHPRMFFFHHFQDVMEPRRLWDPRPSILLISLTKSEFLIGKTCCSALGSCIKFEDTLSPLVKSWA